MPSESRPAPGSGLVRLSFRPEPRLLATVRLVVGVAARQAGVDEVAIEDLKVAVSETCAVAVEGCNRAALDAPVELDLATEAGRFRVEVRDRAPEPPEPPAGEVDDRNFGLALVDALADGLAAGSLDGGGHRVSFQFARRG